MNQKTPINVSHAILRFQEPMDTALMMRYIDQLLERYPFLSMSYLGESILGKGIPLLSVGEGERELLYVGGQGGDWETSALLFRWLNDLCEAYQSQSKMFFCNLNYLLSTRRILVVPMLNPDGIGYALGGVEKDHVLYDRLLSMNEGRQDFSAWRANARGVDLRRNYFAGFSEQKQKEIAAGIFAGAPKGYSGESPESEPEIGHLCNFIRYQQSIQAVLSLEGAGEKIYDTYRGRNTPRGKSMGESLARWSGYALSAEENDETAGSLLAFCIEERNLPCFSIRCGKEEGKTDHFYLYLQLRKMLFGAMTLI